MKIIHIANKYDYGRQELGFSNEYTNLYETLVQMNGGENEVLFFPVDELAREKSALELNKKLIDFVLKEKPKAVFFNGGKSIIRDETIKNIGHVPIRNICAVVIWASYSLFPRAGCCSLFLAFLPFLPGIQGTLCSICLL